MSASNDSGFRVSPDVQNFLDRRHSHFINGQWSGDSGRDSIPVINPTTETVISHIVAGTAEDVDDAVSAARGAFPAWRAVKPAARAQILWKIADLIERDAPMLTELEFLDNGKPLLHARRGDVAAAIETFRYFAGWCTKIYGRTATLSKPGNIHAYTVKEPVGVVGLIIPWNFPLLMAAWKLAPALAAGCTTILKPAEETSLSALRLAELLTEAGVPDGVVNVVTGYGHVVGAALAAHDNVDKVSFTGSTEVGKLIVRAATGNLKKVSLELGGKSPVIVLPDADVDQAAQSVADGIFHNAGQICAAGSRTYIHRSIYDAVLEKLHTKAETLRIGPGHKPDTQMGPLVSAKHRQRVARYVDNSIKSGSTLVTGGTTVGDCGFFYKPTIISGTTIQAPIVQEEVFGPVLVAEAYDDLDQAISWSNNSIYGLVARVWTKDIAVQHYLAEKLEAGTISFNAGGGPDPNLPFGGYKQSGWGREHGEDGLELFLQTKSVLVGY